MTTPASDRHIPALMRAISRVPGLAGAGPGSLVIERLGGLSNVNYYVKGPGECAVIRLPGSGTGAYVNRRCEAANLIAAARAGVAPQVLYSDGDSGVLATRYIEGAAPVTFGEDSKGEPATDVAGALRTLHCRAEPFGNAFDPFALVDRYVSVLEACGQPLPEDYAGARRSLWAWRTAAASLADTRTPCHGDVVPANLLDDGQRIRIVDFEFSGNYDPLWDLADFAGEAGLSPEQESRLLARYYAGEPVAPLDRALFGYFKALSLLVAALWARVQAAHGNPAADFDAYAAVRLALCSTIMSGRAFAEWTGLLAEAGPRGQSPARAASTRAWRSTR